MTKPPTTPAELETAEEFWFNAMRHDLSPEDALWLIGARDAAVARDAKLQALCDMHNTAMRLRKYGREPEWLGAAFTELRAKYEVK